VEPNADYTVDFRGAIRWLALLKITQLFRKMAHNQTIVVQGMDPDTRADLLKVLPEMSYELLSVDEESDASYKMHLRKRDFQMGHSNPENNKYP
jgi:TusA-related sulfurtransferase